MRLHAKDGIRGVLIDLDTGRAIEKPIWFDTETGEFEAYQISPEGKILETPQGDYLTYKAKGRMRFYPGETVKARPPKSALEAPPPSKKLPPVKRTKAEKLAFLLLDLPCQHYACNRFARWMVSDEVELPPVKGVNGKWYARAQVVDIRFYCDFHYKPPRLLDHNGEVVKEFEEAGGVRPQ